MSNKFALYSWYRDDESGWGVCEAESFLKELEHNKKFYGRTFVDHKELICTFNTAEEAIEFCCNKYLKDDENDSEEAIKMDIYDCLYWYFYKNGDIDEAMKYEY